MPFLPREKFDALLSHIPEKTKPFITFLYFCGVRLGEALQIERSQADLAGGLIRLEGEQTKNSEPRTVPLPDVLITMLEAVEARGAPSSTEPTCGRFGTNRVLPPDSKR
jgi:integrase